MKTGNPAFLSSYPAQRPAITAPNTATVGLMSLEIWLDLDAHLSRSSAPVASPGINRPIEIMA